MYIYVYKYIYVFHNCISFLPRWYAQSSFFSLFLCWIKCVNQIYYTEMSTDKVCIWWVANINPSYILNRKSIFSTITFFTLISSLERIVLSGQIRLRIIYLLFNCVQKYIYAVNGLTFGVGIIDLPNVNSERVCYKTTFYQSGASL